MKKVLYEELLPEEFVQRMQEMPVAGGRDLCGTV